MIRHYFTTLSCFLLPLLLVAIEIPEKFEDVLVLDQLIDPASMAFAPDGRLFFGERITGNLRTASYDAASDQWVLHPNPFYTFDVPTERHRSAGLRGIAFDPDFPNNGFIYIFYMAHNPRHNRVVRIQADPSNPHQALQNTETVLMKVPFNGTSSSGSHNGGDMLFGQDGKLYFTTGDGWNGGDDVQQLDTYTGKVFRINKDGSIPTDNPFYDQATGNFRAIYALGLRNPYTMAIRPETGDIYINEARGNNKADVYRIRANDTDHSANFGHDGFNGIGNSTSEWTNVSATGGLLVTGGAWYPENGYWPAAYRGNYFAALWGGNGSDTDGRIVRVDSDGNAPQILPFANKVFMSPGRHKPVMCKIGPDQNLYYLLTDYETSRAQIRMIRYTGQAAAAAPLLEPAPGQYNDPQTISLSSSNSNAKIYYTLDGSIPDENAQLYTTPVLLTATSTLRAIAYADDLLPSPVSGGQYIIGPIPNQLPIAYAGPDRVVEVGQRTTLNGSLSYDPDGSALEIIEEWKQLSGPPIFIEDSDETVANFTPTIPGTYVFQIIVTDIQGGISKDQIIIQAVSQINDVLDGLVARWKMERGNGTFIDDFSDNAYRGQIEGASWDANSADGSPFALRFDGQDDLVHAGNLDLSSNQMSITFWFKADHFDIHDARFISKAIGQQAQEHLWMVSALDKTKLRFRLRTDGNTTTLISDANQLRTNEWMHVAATYDGTAMQLYLNGLLIGTTNKSGQIDSDPDVEVALGNQPRNATGGPRPFAGLLDEVRIYGKVLTSEEVNTIYQAQDIQVSIKDEFNKNPVKIYPNPSNGIIWIQPLKQKTNYSILDLAGRLVQFGEISPSQLVGKISIAILPKGIYMLKIGDQYEKRIIKE